MMAQLRKKEDGSALPKISNDHDQQNCPQNATPASALNEQLVE
jgi:hypothetical protein